MRNAEFLSLLTPHSPFRTPHSEQPSHRLLFLFAIISRLSSVKLVTPAGYSHSGRSALRHVQPGTSNPADLRSRRGGRRSASHFFRAVPAGAEFRSPQTEGTQPILIARGGSFAVLSPRWVMWQANAGANRRAGFRRVRLSAWSDVTSFHAIVLTRTYAGRSRSTSDRAPLLRAPALEYP